MERKDFSAIAELMKSNGVGFVKLFFKSNIHPGVLNRIDMDTDIEDIAEGEDVTATEWIIDLSDGKQYLGSIYVPFETLNCLDLNHDTSVSEEEEDSIYHIYELKMPEYFNSNNGRPEIILYFHHWCGECFISCDDKLF